MYLPTGWVGCVAVALALCGWCLTAQGAEDSEAALRKEFQQAYQGAQKPDQRKAAVQKLANCKERLTMNLAFQVAQSDPDPGVRMAAFTAITGFPDTDGTVADALVRFFELETDHDQKGRYAQALPRLDFKYRAAASLASWVIGNAYPEMPKVEEKKDYRDPRNPGKSSTATNKDTGYRGADNVRRGQKLYGEVIGALNAITKQNFHASKDGRLAVQKWWPANGANLARTDAALAAKLRAEAEAKKKAEDEARKKDAADAKDAPKP